MRRAPITLDAWKVGVSKSSRIRKGENVRFTETKNLGMHTIHAGIEQAMNVLLGCYIVTDYNKENNGTGWWHE